jgi:DNA repair protein RecO (recombination protein O)
MILETDVIVLQTRKYSETSKIVVMFSKKFGKISVLAKGAFSAKSKFGAGLEPLSYSNICFYQNPGNDLHLLKSIEIVAPFNKISKNYDALIAGLVVVEMVSKTQQENCENEELFIKLVDFLNQLNYQSELAFSLCLKFQFELSKNLGFNINIDEWDLHFGNGKIKISLEDGSMIITNAAFNNFFSFGNDSIKKIIDVVKLQDMEGMSETITAKDLIEAITFFSKFFSNHLGKLIYIKSISLISNN